MNLNPLDSSRPAENSSGTAAIIVGAIGLILDGLGIHVDSRVFSGVIILLGFLPALVTWVTTRQIKAGTHVSKADGTVTDAPGH